MHKFHPLYHRRTSDASLTHVVQYGSRFTQLSQIAGSTAALRYHPSVLQLEQCCLEFYDMEQVISAVDEQLAKITLLSYCFKNL